MREPWIAAILSALVMTALAAVSSTAEPGRSTHRLAVRAPGVDHVNFVLYVPTVPQPRDDGYPLILFLHGSEQRGDNPSMLDDLPILSFAEEDGGYPFVTVVPQCPSGEHWSPVVLRQLLDAVESMVKVDRSRVYLTGFSMGGFGTWQTAAALPGVFAAIAPLCGFADIPDARLLAAIPVWAFHGALDRNIPVGESEKMIDTLRRDGADARLTVYPDLAHDCWTMTYRDSRLYLWFLDHSLDGPLAALETGSTGS